MGFSHRDAFAECHGQCRAAEDLFCQLRQVGEVCARKRNELQQLNMYLETSEARRRVAEDGSNGRQQEIELLRDHIRRLERSLVDQKVRQGRQKSGGDRQRQ